ncbi:MAG: hypothetical protein II920_01855 [Clostridia bacterium]|nr:hypothetical protein [Clostridia bacterium]
MAAKPKRKQFDIPNLAIAAVVVILVIVLLVILFKPVRVEKVTVTYSGIAAQKAQNDGFSDIDFIRISGVTNRKMSEMNEWRISARDGIASLGGYELDGINKTSRTGVELVISARVPMAVISTGAGYLTIDSEQYIVEKKSTYTKGTYILINGVNLRNTTVGQIARDYSTDGRLENAMKVLKIIYMGSWQNYFTDIYMADNKEVWLFSVYNIPVKLSLWYEDTMEKDIAASVQVLIEKGSQKASGEIIAVNGNVYWDEDDDDFQLIKGK